MKYKATERYTVGFTNARGIFGGSTLRRSFDIAHDDYPDIQEKRDADAVMLRDLWVVKFGVEPISWNVLTDESGEWQCIARVLTEKGLAVAYCRPELQDGCVRVHP